MERTVPQVIRSPLFQLYKRANDLNNIKPGENLLYGVLRDHKGSNIIRNTKSKSLIRSLLYLFSFKKQLKTISSLGENLTNSPEKKHIFFFEKKFKFNLPSTPGGNENENDQLLFLNL